MEENSRDYHLIVNGVLQRPITVGRRNRQYGLRRLGFVLACLLCLNTTLPSRANAKDAPRVRSITVKKITLAEDDSSKAVVAFEINGEKFGKANTPTVKLINQETGASVAATIVSHDDNKIVASAQLRVGTTPSKYVFQMTINGADVILPDHISDYTLEVTKEAKKEKKVEPFEITFETFKSEAYPSLYSLQITNKTKDDTPGFSPNPALMKVDIVPPGATNVTIQPGSSPHQMFVTFLAPEKFDVKGLSITVFDPGSTLGNNQPIAFSTPFKEKVPKADPNQPTISDIDILAIQRGSGYGRLKIEGTGFGEYKRPPFSGEKELLCCLNRSRNSREQSDRRSNDKQIDGEVCKGVSSDDCEDMSDWRRAIEERVNILLVPRNRDLRVERTQVVYIDDKVIDVYFEFTHFVGYSEPFRLASATVTINKGGVQEARATSEKDEVSAVLAGPQTYIASKSIGPKRDDSLKYSYTILDKPQVNYLLGKGIAENFYVIQLSILNMGEKDINIPLSAIEAEVEWAQGPPDKQDLKNPFEFMQGPATLSPSRLDEVSAFFDANNKVKGKQARLFNILDGVTTLGAALIPVFGHNIERPTAILAGGLIPGLHKAFGDLSGQQLQNLTSMSWQNVEVAPAKSKAPIIKLIYIQRNDQEFSTFKKRQASDGTLKVRKRLNDILGLDVAGYEIVESTATSATPK